MAIPSPNEEVFFYKWSTYDAEPIIDEF